MNEFARPTVDLPHYPPHPTERILIVDDEPLMRRSLGWLIESPGREILKVGSGLEAIAALKGGAVDLMLLDIHLPDLSGLELLEWIATNEIPTSVIMVSATDSIDDPIRALRSGATDFVRKTELDDIQHKVNKVLSQRRLERQHAQTTARLEHSLVFIEALLAQAPQGIAVFNCQTGSCILVNGALVEILGVPAEELRGTNFRALEYWQGQGLDLIAAKVLRDGEARSVEISITNRKGSPLALECAFSRFEAEGKLYLLVMCSDVTARKRLEEENRRIESQMLHVQKLESLGVLAGGIAHDFNNILTAILGNAELAYMRLAPGSAARDNIRRIEQAAQRAAELARQMLAYSGKGRFMIQTLDVNRAVREMTQMLEVSISKKAELKLDFQEKLPRVEVDATQLRQIIMNLVINASEAMNDEPGTITVSTAAIKCHRNYLSQMWIDDQLAEGLYLRLQISDTGCGMDQETAAKIFDPFFTTKFTGRGLGMAAVLGIVRGHGGAIRVDTEKGKGTTFTILLPTTQRDSASCEIPAPPVEEWRGSGQLLLVDDEKTIQLLGKDMLESLGFEVLTASDGNEALELYRKHHETVIAVILDLTMPQLDGEQTFRELRCINPQVGVVMSSGYNEQEVTRKFAGQQPAGFVQKPYTIAELTRALRQIIEVDQTPQRVVAQGPWP